jgi:hypothetical protein
MSVTFRNFAAQGDVYFRRVQKLPKDLVKKASLVVAHSETGHHHAFPKGSNVELFATKDPLVCYLRVAGTETAKLEHLRPFDTHETIEFTAGTYEVRRQREHTPDGWRQIQD